jgi:hypothetical protein
MFCVRSGVVVGLVEVVEKSNGSNPTSNPLLVVLLLVAGVDDKRDGLLLLVVFMAAAETESLRTVRAPILGGFKGDDEDTGGSGSPYP